MSSSAQPSGLFFPSYAQRLCRFRACCWWLVLVMSWAALVLPLGLSVSHGAAALSAALHDAADRQVGGHGHVHEDDAQGANAHAHHAGDHFHETAHVPSKGVFPPDATVAAWSAQPPVTLPWPAPHRLERPPAG